MRGAGVRGVRGEGSNTNEGWWWGEGSSEGD